MVLEVRETRRRESTRDVLLVDRFRNWHIVVSGRLASRREPNRQRRVGQPSNPLLSAAESRLKLHGGRVERVGMDEPYRPWLLHDSKRCYRLLQLGVGVIAATFAWGLAVVVTSAFESAYDVLVMPALFVGLGLLLLGVGTHLHVMHLNVLRMIGDDGEHP